ncbi:MAG: hypothetical protein IJ524_02750 [Bacteroidales bacterium]|nr:hypothetical protein [Bacteroidales bacterium]
MKKPAYIYIGVLAVLLLTATVWRLRPAEPEGSVLYERCKDVPGVRAGFIKDYPLNDSLTVRVTIVEALTDEGWEWMLDEFDFRRLTEKFEEELRRQGKTFENAGREAMHILDFWYSAPDHPEVWGDRLDDPGAVSNDMCIASPYFHWVAVFQARTTEARKVVFHDYMWGQVDADEPLMLPNQGKKQ